MAFFNSAYDDSTKSLRACVRAWAGGRTGAVRVSVGAPPHARGAFPRTPLLPRGLTPPSRGPSDLRALGVRASAPARSLLTWRPRCPSPSGTAISWRARRVGGDRQGAGCCRRTAQRGGACLARCKPPTRTAALASSWTARSAKPWRTNPRARAAAAAGVGRAQSLAGVVPAAVQSARARCSERGGGDRRQRHRPGSASSPGRHGPAYASPPNL